MTSIEVEHEMHHGWFQSVFIAQEQIYHNTAALLPQRNQWNKFLQIYLTGNDLDFPAQIDKSCQYIPGLQHDTKTVLQRMLYEYNMLVNEFKSALKNISEIHYKVVICADRKPAGKHERQ